MDIASEFSTIALLKGRLARLGYRFENLILDERHYCRFIAPGGGSWLTSEARINYPFISSTARSISSEKSLAYALADSLGLTVPKTFKLQASELANLQPELYLPFGPLVVKPSNASLSHGLTMNITSADGLQTALQHAATYANTVLIQQQIAGEEIRFVVLNGHVTAALLRQSPQLTGDGTHTLQQLLDSENQDRSQLHMPYLTYPQLQPPLIDLTGWDMTVVPALAEVVKLGRATMIGSGASVYNITGQVHQSYIATAQQLARELGDGLIVVDILVVDYTQPQTDANYAFIEFNMSPVFKLFYSCRDGRHYDILTELIPSIDKAITQAGRTKND